MLTVKEKQALRDRLYAIEKNGGAETELASIVRAMLEEMPSDGDHAAAVRDLQTRNGQG